MNLWWQGSVFPQRTCMNLLTAITGLLLLLLPSGRSGFSESVDIHQHRVWDQLLKEYVTPTGKVDYSGLKQDSRLDLYLDQLAQNPVSDAWSRSQKLAYWINAYNAFTVKLITEHYPVASIRDIQRPWAKKFVELGEQKYSLNQIEHDIIRPLFQEPRIHFALVCAAISCPKLLNTSYQPELLDQQLDHQTRYFLNKSGKNKLAQNQVSISQLFNWYGRDFKEKESIIAFLNRYSETAIDPKAKIEFLPYDWSLND